MMKSLLKIDRLVHQKTVAAALRMTAPNVRHWVRTGKLPPLDLDIARHLCGWWPETLQAHSPKIAELIYDYIAFQGQSVTTTPST